MSEITRITPAAKDVDELRRERGADAVKAWLEQELERAEHKRRGSRFQLQHVRELELKPTAWLIRRLIEADCLAMVFADPEAAKSLLAIDAGCCVATGTEFHGLPVKQGPVVYIAGEGHNGLARRLKAWEIRHQINLSDAPLYVSGGPAALCHPGSANDVAEAVDEIAAEHGSPVLVVVDTVARNFGPGDENSTQDMSAFIAAADLIRVKHRATVLLVHHTGHADKSRARGAMALHGALDAEYRMDKDETGVVRLEATKMKDAPHPEPMAFRICAVELGITDDEGEPVTSAILDSTSYEAPPKRGKAGRGKWQTAAIEALDTLEQAGQRVAMDDWRRACLDADMPRQRFAEASKALADQGLVSIEYGFVWSGLSGPSGSINKPDRTDRGQADNQDANRTQSGQTPDGCRKCDGEGCDWCERAA